MYMLLRATGLLSVLLLCCMPCTAQQLVPNPGFEELLVCPDFQSQLDRTTHWISPSVQGTPDYYHACASNALYAVPQSTVGVQEPVDGEAYVGFFLYIGQPVMAGWREYIQAPLTEALNADRCYRFRLHANLTEYSLRSTWSLGVRFSSGPVALPDPFIPGPPAHITLPPGTFLDHATWTVLEGDYIAEGGEDHLMIGNFNSDADTPIQNVSSTLGNAGPFAYVLVDALSLVPCELTTSVRPYLTDPGVELTPEALRIGAIEWKSALVRVYDLASRTVVDARSMNGQCQWPPELRGVLVVELVAANGAVHRVRFVR